MIPADKGTRDLLPPIQAHAAEIIGTGRFAGSFAPPISWRSRPPGRRCAGRRSAADRARRRLGPRSDADQGRRRPSMPPMFGSAAGEPFIPISVVEDFFIPKPPSPTKAEGKRP